MQNKLKVGIIAIVLILLATTGLAQDNCMPIVEQALEATNFLCQDTGRNEICYGNNLIFAQPQPGVALNFQVQGDITPINSMSGMTLSPLDINANLWGVSLMSLQADIPDIVPGQNVIILVFGNVQLGEVTEGGAFHFQSGIGNAQCTQAPDSGIMVRTPEGVTEVTLSINEVNITLGSTAFIEADQEHGMDITLLDGNARVNVSGIVQEMGFSQSINIPMNLAEGRLTPSGPPSPAMPWDAEKVARVFVVYNSMNELNNPGASGETGISTEPCTIFTDQSFHAGLRVGPGENRTRRAWLDPNNVVDVTGKKTVDGRIWWQLDKFQAYEKGANSVLELWVAEDQVTEQGNCDQVVDVDAPPIIQPPTEPQPVVTEDPIINPEPGQTEEPPTYVPPTIILSAQDTSVFRRSPCTTIFVTVDAINRAFLSGPGTIDDTTVEGPNWSTMVCLPATPGSYTYTLDVYDLAETLHQRFISIQVT